MEQEIITVDEIRDYAMRSGIAPDLVWQSLDALLQIQGATNFCPQSGHVIVSKSSAYWLPNAPTKNLPTRRVEDHLFENAPKWATRLWIHDGVPHWTDSDMTHVVSALPIRFGDQSTWKLGGSRDYHIPEPDENPPFIIKENPKWERFDSARKELILASMAAITTYARSGETETDREMAAERLMVAADEYNQALV